MSQARRSDSIDLSNFFKPSQLKSPIRLEKHQCSVFCGPGFYIGFSSNQSSNQNSITRESEAEDVRSGGEATWRGGGGGGGAFYVRDEPVIDCHVSL